MARAALNWSIQRLADASGVHRKAISNFETGRYRGDPQKLAAVRAALDSAGVEFTNGAQPGVRMKSAPPATSDEASLPDIPETDGEPYDGAPV
jgi:transcriptional regulator with XRE-family HTH domain